MEVAAEGVGVLGAEVGVRDAAQGEVHDGEAARDGVALLAVDADVAASMLLRRLSAASQSFASNPRVAEVSGEVFDFAAMSISRFLASHTASGEKICRDAADSGNGASSASVAVTFSVDPFGR